MSDSVLGRIRRRVARLAGVDWIPEQVRDDHDAIGALADAHDETSRTARHALAVAEVANAGAVDAAARASAATERAAEATVQAAALPRDELLGELHRHMIELDRRSRAEAVMATTRWIEHLDPDPSTKVSVVMPTRDRADLLGGAIDSVLAQTHANFELLIVDDASTDHTADVLASYDDARIRVLRGEGRGACVARNVGIDASTGDLLTYLDDDNRLDRLWLQGIAWTFARNPDATMCYGARLIDAIDRVLEREPTRLGSMPSLQFEPFDRATLERDNSIDNGVIAHRPGPHNRFDDELWWFGDWDLVLTLTAAQDPIELPLVAVHYTSDPIPRLSDAGRVGSERYELEAERVRAKHRGRRSPDA